jgi:predicted CopG family antitoxin
MSKNHNLSKLHNIAVDDDNYHALKNLGKVGDSFNDVIRELLKRRAEELRR